MARRGVAACAAALAVGGCGGNDPAPSAAEAVPAVGTAASASSCKDPDSDGGNGDLVKVTLTKRLDAVTAQFFTDTAAPDTGPATWIVTAMSADGAHGIVLGAKIERAGKRVVYVFDIGRNEPYEYDNPLTVKGRSMTATWPAKAITDLGPGTKWIASVQRDLILEEPHDCPEQADGELTNWVTFPPDWF